jgi:GntR family transcriptional regulator / MocR family aminotransferase
MDFVFHLNSSSPIALHGQLYSELRLGILTGRFEAGARLPGSRHLADFLGISRMTVNECYERLASEGYLETRSRSGTFVCQSLPDLSFSPAASRINEPRLQSHYLPRLSRFGNAVNTPLRPPDSSGTIRLNMHGPDVVNFPVNIWSQLQSRRMKSGSSEILDYTQHFAGDIQLRHAVTGYLRKSRALICDPDQVIIVSGSQQAIYLTSRLLLNEGDVVAMESPGYRLAGKVFSSQGAAILPIPVDTHGMKVSELKKHGARAKLVYVTPSHQYPTGVSLSRDRRMELLAWACKSQALILEDDYDSEFRYSGRPLSSLQGMVDNAPVLYTGTFSKLLFPSLRLGYVVVPRSLKDAFISAKLLSDFQCPSLEQAVLADFICERHLEPYIRRMRTIYAGRRRLLVNALTTHFGSRVKISGDDAGMYILAEFKTHLSQSEARDRALRHGVSLEQLYWPGDAPPPRPGRVNFVCAFAGRSDAEIPLVAERLSSALL